MRFEYNILVNLNEGRRDKRTAGLAVEYRGCSIHVQAARMQAVRDRHGNERESLIQGPDDYDRELQCRSIPPECAILIDI